MFLISNSLSGQTVLTTVLCRFWVQPSSRSLHVTRNRYSTWNRKKTTLFSPHYLRNRSTSDIGVLGYIGVL